MQGLAQLQRFAGAGNRSFCHGTHMIGVDLYAEGHVLIVIHHHRHGTQGLCQHTGSRRAGVRRVVACDGPQAEWL